VSSQKSIGSRTGRQSQNTLKLSADYAIEAASILYDRQGFGQQRLSNEEPAPQQRRSWRGNHGADLRRTSNEGALRQIRL